MIQIRSSMIRLRFQSRSVFRQSPRYFSSANDTDAPLLKTQQDGVLTLTLNRPKQRNALNRQLLDSLYNTLLDIPSDVRAVVLQSEGPVFCSGHDLKELMAKDSKEQQELFQRCSEMMQLLPKIPQPTLCAVQGLATAAGCQLVAACDVVLAKPTSSFCTPGVQIGLFCHTPAVELVRCVGIKRALDMLYTGRVITAQEALDYGLVTHVVPDPRQQVQEMAQTLASQSACAMKLGKQAFYQQVSTGSLEEAYGVATRAMLKNLETRDAKHGIQSFLDKKPPTWKHE